jgi:GNAT superfamily N-acetyltransferase
VTEANVPKRRKVTAGVTAAEIRIRLAAEADVPALQALERDAAELFRETGYWLPAFEDARSALDHAQGIASGVSWVAVDAGDAPIGFALCSVVDGHLHLLEMAVARSHQRRSIGTRLLNAVIDHARWRFDPCVTLTTDRHLPWNAPFYARHGFIALDSARLSHELATILRAEAMAGLDPARRVAMAKIL